MFIRSLSETLHPLKSMLKIWSILSQVIIHYHPILQSFLWSNHIPFRKTSLCSTKCYADSECINNERCVDGQCQSSCSNNNHCELGFRCFQNSCMKSCQSSTNCQSSDYCHIDHKVCHLRCSTNENCSGGYKCFNGECLSYCSLSNHCKANQYCDK